jgi:hypothetical protein
MPLLVDATQSMSSMSLKADNSTRVYRTSAVLKTVTLFGYTGSVCCITHNALLLLLCYANIRYCCCCWQQITALATVPSTTSGTLLLVGLEDGTIALRDFPGFSLAFELSYSVSSHFQYQLTDCSRLHVLRVVCSCCATACIALRNTVVCSSSFRACGSAS